MRYNVYTDGGARGNPGPAASAFVIKDQLLNKIAAGSKYLGGATNNIAEYQGLIQALTWFNHNSNLLVKDDSIVFHLDSQLIVNQMLGKYKIKQPHLQKLHNLSQNLASQLNISIDYTYIPRLKNHEADRLVNESLNNNT